MTLDDWLLDADPALQAPDGLWGGAAWAHDDTDTFHVLVIGPRWLTIAVKWATPAPNPRC